MNNFVDTHFNKLLLVAFGCLLGAMPLAALAYHESNQLQVIIQEPRIEIDGQFMVHLNDCKEHGNLSDKECDAIFGLGV